VSVVAYQLLSALWYMFILILILYTPYRVSRKALLVGSLLASGMVVAQLYTYIKDGLPVGDRSLGLQISNVTLIQLDTERELSDIS